MDSISSLAKKHCHCAVNIICGILFILLTAVHGFQTRLAATPVSITYLTITAAITLAVWLYIAGLKIGCSLIKIPLIVIALFFFSASLLFEAVGIIFLYHNEAKNYINEILGEYGYHLMVSTQFIGVFLIIIGLIVFGLSFCTLSGVRYFNSVKQCLNGKIKRGGAKLFGITSIVLFVIITISEIVYIVMLISNGNFIFDTQTNIFLLKLIFIDLLLLCVGISANSFGNKAYAYKVFENQMMKVETNADGTVYVPINEENEFSSEKNNNSANSTDKQNSSELNNTGHRPYIKEGQISPPNSENHEKVDKPTNESDII